MKVKTLLCLLVISVLASCAVRDTDAAADNCECRLSGQYRFDKLHFCPSGFNAKTVEFYLLALEEKSQQSATAPALTLEETLAVNYDAYWAVKKTLGVTSPGMAALLSMVGCEKESSDEFRAHDIGKSSAFWGELGVAAHVLRKYEESVRAFDQAVRLEPDYFATKPLQKRIAEAARAGRPLQP